jgi:hypothetical protein
MAINKNFVVRNGLEVATNLIFADSNYVGIGTTVPEAKLHVVGVSTFSADVSVGIDTSGGVVLTAPNGTRYRLFVDNAGSLGTVAI